MLHLGETGRDRRVDQTRNQFKRDGESRSAAICASVQAALQQKRLLFAYQPVVCALTGKIDYFECLLRMRHAEGGLVAGGEFIASLEELDLIGLVDHYVLELVIGRLTKYPAVRLGLNISASTARVGSWLRSLVAVSHTQPDVTRRLVVEITETSALRDIDEAAYFVDTVRRTGCRVALDDFGVGHASMRHLECLAVDTVKIDGSFVRSSADSRTKRSELRDLLGPISGFGCATVAEGVENAEDEAVARAEGFGFLQGYHLGRPSIEPAWLRGLSADSAEASALNG